MESLHTLGLWGDGDEIWAIEDAFAALDLQVPVEDASRWVTVGDLWESVLRVSPDRAADKGAWAQFRQALSQETNVDWAKIDVSTVLIDGRGHNIFSRLMFSLREKFRKAA